MIVQVLFGFVIFALFAIYEIDLVRKGEIKFPWKHNPVTRQQNPYKFWALVGVSLVSSLVVAVAVIRGAFDQ
jgi:hypothetical protein